MRSTPAATNSPITPPSVSSASPSAADVRFAAATGLLSSCARPADMRPRAASFSRWCSAPSIREITGPNTLSTRSNTAGVAHSSVRNVSGSTSPTRLRSRARIVTRADETLSAAIAASHVGASWTWSCCSRPSTST